MVEKDIELNEREITEMEEEFVNLEKLHVDDDAEGARYLSSPASVLCHCPKYIQQCQCPSVPQQSYGHLYCLSSEKLFVTRIYINVTKLSDVKGWQLSHPIFKYFVLSQVFIFLLLLKLFLLYFSNKTKTVTTNETFIYTQI